MGKQKSLGQFFTPAAIADFMASLVCTEETQSVLDPAVGHGVFIDSVKAVCGDSLEIVACDVDKEFVRFVQAKHSTVNVLDADYLSKGFASKFDAIICNPPYNRFQNVQERDSIIAGFHAKYGIRLSGYTNMCIFFLLKSLHEMADNGKCCYIIPYEFLNTGYGSVIKEFFLQTKTLKSIIKIDNSINVFEDAITTSCILLFEGSPHKSIEFVTIHDLAELQDYCNTQHHIVQYSYSELDYNAKWLPLFDKRKIQTHSDNLVPLSTFARVKRGIATGDNAFFSLAYKSIVDLGLSKQVCLPCVSKSADIVCPVLTEQVFQNLVDSNKRMFLFDGTKAATAQDVAYIESGEKQGVNTKYLTRHRTPWYSVEYRLPAPILLSVFSRGKLKVVRNEIGVQNLTTFHGLYLHPLYDSFTDILFCYLLTDVAQKVLYRDKREYGNGLDKFEPNDLNNANVLDLTMLSSEDKQRIETLYQVITASQDTALPVQELNAIFGRYLEDV